MAFPSEIKGWKKHWSNKGELRGIAFESAQYINPNNNYNMANIVPMVDSQNRVSYLVALGFIQFPNTPSEAAAVSLVEEYIDAVGQGKFS